MNTKIIYGLLIATVITATSCEKVIDYDLNTTESKLVIEADFTNNTEFSKVKLGKSKNFTDNNTFEAVSNAVITISDNDGNSEILNETEPGIYKPIHLAGVSGRTYNLTVVSQNHTYTSQSTMPNAVTLDSIGFTKINMLGNIKTLAVPYFLDPVNVPNFYRFTQYVEGKKTPAIFITNDFQNDGLINHQALRSVSDEVKIEKGKQVEVIMMGVDENVYNYFNSLSQISSNSGPNATGSPANPITNIKGGALGYFSACTVQKKSIAN